MKKLFKLFCYAIMILVVGTLGYRLYTLNHYPAFAKGVIETDTLKQSYASGTLRGITWELPAEFDEAGEFFAHEPIYFKNEKTLIVTIRYNNSLLKTLKFDGDGEELELYPSLYADGTERVLPTTYEYGDAYNIYCYRRYVFEGVDLSQYEHLYLDIHRDESYAGTPYTTLEIYDSNERVEDYKLTSADKSELRD